MHSDPDKKRPDKFQRGPGGDVPISAEPSIPGGNLNEGAYYEARYLSVHGNAHEAFALDAPDLSGETNVTLTCWPWEPVALDEDGGTLWKRKCVVSW